MKKISLLVLALSAGVLAAGGSLEERVDGLQAQIDRVMARAGIHFNGEFRSQFLNSSVSGDALNNVAITSQSNSQTRKTNEAVEFTSVDFDITARPNTALAARAIFRLHQDWRIFFSDLQNPVTSRWLSVDGSIMDGIFKYNLGDYRKKLTPLTLWAPDLELLYEPEIFAQGRRYAMGEAFLGDNFRVLQGGNVEFNAELYPILKELSADIFAARLQSTGNQETGVLPPPMHDNPPLFDKYLAGFNLETEALAGLTVGVSDIIIFDHLVSGKGMTEDAAKLAAQSTNVMSGRLSVDNRLFMDDGFINVGLMGEVAFSSDRKYELNNEGKAFEADAVTGMALNAGLFARLSLGEEDAVNIRGYFINNAETFRNDAAQTPTFFLRDIMNSEQEFGRHGLTNPFDAMYRTVFKYAPSQYLGESSPRGKYAYNNAILPKPLGAYEAMEGISVFQNAMPSGLASSNRTGPVVHLTGSFLNKGITLGGQFAMLNSIDDVRLYRETVVDENGDLVDIFSDPTGAEYMVAGGGLSLDVATFVPVVGPSLELSGSYMMYNSKYVNVSSSASTLLSAGLNYQFHQRFGLLFGFQQLVTVLRDGSDNDVNTLTFDNLAFGLNYKVAEGGNVTAKLTMTSANADPVGGESIGYNALQPEVYLTVKF